MGRGALDFFRNRRWTRRTLILGVILATLFALDRLFPPPIPGADDVATLIVARDGTPLRAIAARDGVWRYPVRVDEIAPIYFEALLGYEDRRFRFHPGVDPLALLRAVGQAIANGAPVSGGSTLTMQVARLIEPIPHSATGKLRQILRALQLELRLSKDEILALYITRAPFGGNLEGVSAASWAYLGKPPSRLSRAEAALLAVLPQAPSRLRPDRHPERARAARDKVLARLAQFGDWPAAALAEARAEPVVARRVQPPRSAALLAERLAAEHRDARLIHTTVDPMLQRLAESRLETWVQRLPAKTSGAVLIVDLKDGAVRAYVGSARYADEARLGHVDMVRAQRSPGSTLKPFVYGLALEDGLIHSESLLVDAPRDFDGYRPANFEDRFYGPVSAADALRWSLNVPAVDLLVRVGPSRFAARLRHGGLPLALPRGASPNPAIVLGGAATSLEDLVGAYTALGRDGLAARPRLLDSDPRREHRLLDARAAFVVREVLRAHARPGEALPGIDRSGRVPLAWKTGTSYGHRDTWALGLTPRYAIGVWIGRPDGTPMPGEFGAATALPLLGTLADALPGARDAGLDTPKGVARAVVCWPGGRLAADTAPEHCVRRRDAWIVGGVVPPTLHDDSADVANPALVTLLLDAQGARVRPDCAEGSTRLATLARWPALTLPWLSPQERARAEPPAWSPRCAHVAPHEGLAIEGLRDGATLRRAPGSLVMPTASVRALSAGPPVTWLLDERVVGTSTLREPLRLRFDRAGSRTLVALAPDGRFARIEVRVEL